MKSKNRLRKIFTAMGLATIRPAEALLEKWSMNATRFNQLVYRKGHLGITVS